MSLKAIGAKTDVKREILQSLSLMVAVDEEDRNRIRGDAIEFVVRNDWQVTNDCCTN